MNLKKYFYFRSVFGALILAGFTLQARAQERSSDWLRMDKCARASANDTNVLFEDDFKWGYSLPEIQQKFREIYTSGKRLSQRAYFDQEKNKLMLPPLSESQPPIEIEKKFIQNIILHIEEAFQKNVIDAVFFPDLGHSHLFIPDKRWEKIYAPMPVSQMSLMMQKILADSSIKILYHTAEQLQMLDENKQLLPDERVQFRFKTRNLVGSNDGSKKLLFLQDPTSAANTAHDLPGYYYYSGGFNISASQEGCFVYHHDGQAFYFDISLHDLAPRP